MNTIYSLEKNGVDKSLDAAGAQSTFSMGIDILKKWGDFVILANLEMSLDINISNVITKQLSIKGSCASSGEYVEILDFLSKKLIRTDYVISKRLPLDEAGSFMIKLHTKEIQIL